jgi:L-iditol 2-dehydrogenase
MKAIVLTGIRKMELIEMPAPFISGPKDVLIRMSVVGVCGSDIHYYTTGKIGSQIVEYPFAVGHEGSGVVAATGDQVKRVKPGDKIAIDPAMSCRECDQCLSGRPHTCRKLRFLGCPGQAEGCLTEYIIMPEESCYPLPENLTADHGAISEPLSIGIYSVRKSFIGKSQSAGVLGFGPIGMSVTLALKALGAGPVLVTDKIGERLALAKSEGVESVFNPDETDIVSGILEMTTLGLDTVFECCGQQEALDQAIDLLKPGGKLIVVGIPEFDNWSLNVEKTRRKEISVQFIRRQVDCVNTSLEMMKTGQIIIDNMITHRFPFADTGSAFDLVAGYHDGVMKALIDF